MGEVEDKELERYRRLMTPPDTFEEGFGTKTVIGALFVGFLMMPGSMYMGLVAGMGIGPAARWVTVILFMEIARRSLTRLKQQEIYILYYMAGFAIASPFQGLLWRQFLIQSDAAKSMGIAGPMAETCWWLAPAPETIQGIGNTFLDRAWLPVILMLVVNQLIWRVDHFGLGYILFRLTSDVEKLPFPLAPIGAAGATALAESTSEKKSWRWRTFSIGSMMGLMFGVVYFAVPAISGAVLNKSIQIIPIPWIELTPKTAKVLPAVATGIRLDLGLILLGMVLPFWAVVGGALGFIITAIANPVLYRRGILKTWTPQMETVNTIFANNFDFYLSFTIGLTVSIALVGLFKVFRGIWRMRKEKVGALDALRNPPEGRGDIPFWVGIAIYLFSTASYITITMVLLWPEMKAHNYPYMILFAILLFYGFVYTPLISYATARLEGTVGQALAIPFVREATFILSGYQGIGIWFVPIPMRDYGRFTRQFREIELTGTKLTSIIKTELAVFPILMVASIVFSEFIFRLGAIPSESYPFIQKIWDLRAKNACLIYTSTMGGESPFYEAISGWYISWGLGLGVLVYSFLAVFRLPTLLIYGIVRGLGQTQPHGYIMELTGALLGRYYFQRKYGSDQWLKYAPVLLAGWSCGMGLIGMASVAIALISKSVSQLPY